MCGSSPSRKQRLRIDAAEAKHERGLHKPSQNSGGYGERVPPVPIPNTEVKPFSADGTWLETARESRSLPDPTKKRPHRSGVFSCVPGKCSSPGQPQPSTLMYLARFAHGGPQCGQMSHGRTAREHSVHSGLILCTGRLRVLNAVRHDSRAELPRKRRVQSSLRPPAAIQMGKDRANSGL